MRKTQTRGKSSKTRRQQYAWARAQSFAAMTPEQREAQKAANKAAYNLKEASNG